MKLYAPVSFLSLLTAVVFSLSAFSVPRSAKAADVKTPAPTKTLIAFFSRAGQNYAGGKLQNLKVGNTRVIAEMIHDITGGDLFEIQTVEPYPYSYKETEERAMKEMKTEARPALRETVKDLRQYDVIYLGFPIWFTNCPRAVITFLESGDFSGKVIIPFNTHESSGSGRTSREIQRVCPKAAILTALAVRGAVVTQARERVATWIYQTNEERSRLPKQ